MKLHDEVRQMLQHGNATDKATELWSLAKALDVPDDIMELVKILMEDRSVARMYVPFRYGEVRYIAAETYARLQFRRGQKDPVILRDTIVPLRSDRLAQIREKSGLSTSPTRSLAWFAELRELGLLAVTDEVFDLDYFDMNE
jgi:hypothetical protein